MPEGDNWHGSGRAGDVRKGAIGRDVGVEDPRVSLREAVVHSILDEHVPVVVTLGIDRRAAARTRVALIQARIEPSGDVVRLPAGADCDAGPRDRGGPERSRSECGAIR